VPSSDQAELYESSAQTQENTSPHTGGIVILTTRGTCCIPTHKPRTAAKREGRLDRQIHRPTQGSRTRFA
jgi:hypothetical protein